MLRLRHQFDQFHEISGELCPQKIRPQTDKRLDENHFAQRVQIAPAAGRVADLLEEEQVQLPRERTPRPARPLCRCLQPPVVLGQPGDNPTRIAQAGAAQQDGGGAGQGWDFVEI